MANLVSVYFPRVNGHDDNGEWKMLEGFVGVTADAYRRADARLDYWQDKFPNAIVDILRKA